MPFPPFRSESDFPTLHRDVASDCHSYYGGWLVRPFPFRVLWPLLTPRRSVFWAGTIFVLRHLEFRLGEASRGKPRAFPRAPSQFTSCGCLWGFCRFRPTHPAHEASYWVSVRRVSVSPRPSFPASVARVRLGSAISRTLMYRPSDTDFHRRPVTCPSHRKKGPIRDLFIELPRTIHFGQPRTIGFGRRQQVWPAESNHPVLHKVVHPYFVAPGWVRERPKANRVERRGFNLARPLTPPYVRFSAYGGSNQHNASYALAFSSFPLGPPTALRMPRAAGSDCHSYCGGWLVRPFPFRVLWPLLTPRRSLLLGGYHIRLKTSGIPPRRGLIG